VDLDVQGVWIASTDTNLSHHSADLEMNAFNFTKPVCQDTFFADLMYRTSAVLIDIWLWFDQSEKCVQLGNTSLVISSLLS